MTASFIHELSLEAFDREVLKAPGLVLLEFRTATCPPCNLLAPVLEEIAADFHDRLKVFTVHIEQSRDFARQFRINAVPTLFIYHNGQLTRQLTGSRSKSVLLRELGLSPVPTACPMPPSCG